MGSIRATTDVVSNALLLSRTDLRYVDFQSGGRAGKTRQRLTRDT